MKKILFFAFASYVIGALLALVFTDVAKVYPGISATATSAAGGGNIILFVVIAIVGVVAINIFLLKWKGKAQKHLGSYFELYIYFLMGVFSLYLGTWSALTFQVILLPASIYGSPWATLMLMAGFSLVYGGVFFILMTQTRFANATALVLGIMTIVLMSQFPVYFLLIFFAAMSVYDYIAVFHLKTMLVLANIALDEKKPLPLLIKDGDISSVTQSSDKTKMRCLNCAYLSPLKKAGRVVFFECPMCHRKVRVLSKKKNAIDYEGDKEIYKRKEYVKWFWSKPSALGLGDIAVPGCVIASIAVNFGNLWLFALAGAFIGLLLNMVALLRYRRALPALPLIFGGMITALGIGILLIG